MLLKSEIAPQADKEALAVALSHLQQPTTGSIEGDARQLATLIDEYMKFPYLTSEHSNILPGWSYD